MEYRPSSEAVNQLVRSFVSVKHRGSLACMEHNAPGSSSEVDYYSLHLHNQFL